ncbi:7357_t:CDS:2, partial [Gigaspora rosea]
VKKQVFDSNNSQTSTISFTLTWSKLLATYRSITKNSKNVSRPSTSANINKNINEIAKNLLELIIWNLIIIRVLRKYDTTNEYFDGTRDSDMKYKKE